MRMVYIFLIVLIFGFLIVFVTTFRIVPTTQKQFWISASEFDKLKCQAVENGDATAAWRIANFYMFALDDPAGSKRWLRIAADAGDESAAKNLQYLDDLQKR